MEMSTVKKFFISKAPHEFFIFILKCKNKIKVLSYFFGNNSAYPEFLKYKSKSKCGYKYKKVSTKPDSRWGEAFCDYSNVDRTYTVDLMWTEDPKPGNYGDWLSPYIISKVGNVRLRHVSGVANYSEKHLIALGSVIDCANEKSVVVSAGISDKNALVDIRAKFISVRGLYTKSVIESCGGHCPSNFGDIGFLIRRLYKPKNKNILSKYLLVRHTNQSNIMINLPENYREFSIYAAKAEDVELFVDQLHTAEVVVTSAMHCFITCISYGLPCILISLGDESCAVPGDGVKFLDSLSGVGLPEISPVKITNNKEMFEYIDTLSPYHHKVAGTYLDKIQNSIIEAVDYVKF
jgi:hypothetical protein